MELKIRIDGLPEKDFFILSENEKESEEIKKIFEKYYASVPPKLGSMPGFTAQEHHYYGVDPDGFIDHFYNKNNISASKENKKDSTLAMLRMLTSERWMQTTNIFTLLEFKEKFLNDTSSKFKVGDIVRIAPTSEYYVGDNTNPIKEEGEVIEDLAITTNEYLIAVQWPKGKNAYRFKDLEFAPQKIASSIVDNYSIY